MVHTGGFGAIVTVVVAIRIGLVLIVVSVTIVVPIGGYIVNVPKVVVVL